MHEHPKIYHGKTFAPILPADFQKLRPMSWRLLRRLGVLVAPEAGKIFLQKVPRIQFSDANPIIVVHTQLQTLIQITNLIEELPPKECGLLGNKVLPINESFKIKVRSVVLVCDSAGSIHYVAFAIEPHGLRVLFEVRYNSCNSSGHVVIVRVDPSDDGSLRGSKTLIDRVGLPTIFFGHPGYTCACLKQRYGAAVLQSPVLFEPPRSAGFPRDIPPGYTRALRWTLELN